MDPSVNRAIMEGEVPSWRISSPLPPIGLDLRVHPLDRVGGRTCRLGVIAAGRPGSKRDAPLSNMALAMTLRRLGADVTAHGFRSTFRDWVGERTSFPGDVAEMALAHVVADKTEAAYRRGDLFESAGR